jgi:hypothetical protein
VEWRENFAIDRLASGLDEWERTATCIGLLEADTGVDFNLGFGVIARPPGFDAGGSDESRITIGRAAGEACGPNGLFIGSGTNTSGKPNAFPKASAMSLADW